MNNLVSKALRKAQLELLLDTITCGDYKFELVEKGEELFLLARYAEDDVITGQPAIQTTRKWHISPHATKSEFVQTAFKCAATSMEHRVREMFRYEGKQVFGPHFDVDALASICDELDVRA